MKDQDKSKQQLIAELGELRRRAASQDKETEAALLLQIAPLGIHQCDTSGRITLANPFQENVTGYTADELVGTYIWDRIEPGPQKDSLPAYLKQLVSEQPPPAPFVTRNIRKNGELYDIRVDWNYQRSPQGQVTGFVCIISDITEQRRAEEAVRESERRFRSLFQDSPVGAAIVAPNAQFIQVNRAFCGFLGYLENELVGKSVLSITHPEDRQASSTAIRQALESRPRIERLEKRYLHKSGQVLWGEISSILISDAEGKPAYFVTQVSDISKRKRAEAALRQAHEELEAKVGERTAELTQSHDELRAIYDQVVDGIIIVDPETVNPIRTNAAFRRMLGCSEDEAATVSPAKIHPTEALPTVWEHLEAVQRGNVARLESVPFLRGDGSIRYADVVSSPIHYNQRSCWISFFRDITERKQAMEALHQSHDELWTIYDSMSEGLVILDSESKRLVRVNSALGRMLGYTEEELLSMSIMDVHPADDFAGSQQRIRARAEGRIEEDTDVPMLRKDGSVFYADIMGNPLIYGGRRCVLGLFRDVTERKQAQAALEREQQTLRHLLESSDHERQLIAYEIHDGLAQQLAGAIMQFQTFDHLKQRKPKEAAKAYAAGMTMLQQGHFEARRLIAGVRPPVLDEQGIVAAIAHLVHEQSRLKGPKIDYHSRVDFDRLVAILENAVYRIAQEGLANACQHSKSERVRVSFVQREDRVRIEIRDWGTGFNPREAKEGCYGLVGMRQRARLLGGKCSIRSTPGKGTRIAVELPVVLREPDR